MPVRAPACRHGGESDPEARGCAGWGRRALNGVGERPDAPALVRHDGQWIILWGERSDRLEVVLEGQGAGVWPRSVSLAVWFGVVGPAAMIVVWALLCALRWRSVDLGGPLGLVALAPMMALSLRRGEAFTFGFLCGFFEVSLTMWGASGYTVMIPHDACPARRACAPARSPGRCRCDPDLCCPCLCWWSVGVEDDLGADPAAVVRA